MDHIEYKIIPLTEEIISLLENIRYNAYGMDPTKFPPENTFYSMNLRQNKYLVFGCYIDNKLVGACYISNAYNSIYIEQLFILKKYQRTNLHLGTNILLYALNHKQVIEDYFQTNFKFSYLDNYKNTSNLYQSLGYEQKENLMRKRL